MRHWGEEEKNQPAPLGTHYWIETSQLPNYYLRIRKVRTLLGQKRTHSLRARFIPHLCRRHYSLSLYFLFQHWLLPS